MKHGLDFRTYVFAVVCGLIFTFVFVIIFHYPSNPAAKPEAESDQTPADALSQPVMSVPYPDIKGREAAIQDSKEAVLVKDGQEDAPAEEGTVDVEGQEFEVPLRPQIGRGLRSLYNADVAGSGGIRDWVRDKVELLAQRAVPEGLPKLSGEELAEVQSSAWAEGGPAMALYRRLYKAQMDCYAWYAYMFSSMEAGVTEDDGRWAFLPEGQAPDEQAAEADAEEAVVKSGTWAGRPFGPFGGKEGERPYNLFVDVEDPVFEGCFLLEKDTQSWEELEEYSTLEASLKSAVAGVLARR